MKKTSILLTLLSFSLGSFAEDNLAKKSQNPVGDIVSVPMEYHHYDGVSEQDASVNALFIKPVYPVSVGGMNLINRTIIPVLSLDAGAGGYDLGGIAPKPNFDAERGLGNIQYQGFFSPAQPGSVIWGLGPVIELPTHQNDLGSDHYSAGISGVVLTMPGNWVVGALLQNIWSLTDKQDEADINKMTFQYFINYNFEDGWYATSTPINTVDWEAGGGNKVTIPIGGGFGRLVRIGKVPVDFRMQAFSYLEKPEHGPDWNMQFSVKILFPK